mmetsp:Transcript_71323/g.163487  ORF Transcript_71323/g.163487 Transcript_71323/m.163487 type:complete len:166 (-) Transcript_71323:6-503(-)
MAWALKRIFNDIRQHMVANNPAVLQQYGDSVGHWFLHAYDQYELWRFFLRHLQAVRDDGERLLCTLDVEQRIFASTVMKARNWPAYLGSHPVEQHSIDVDEPLVFDAPQQLFEVKGCRARFVGRPHFPLFWHGNGPRKEAWDGLRDRLVANGCFASMSGQSPTQL